MTPTEPTADHYIGFRRAEYYAREQAWADAVADLEPVVAAHPDDRAARELLARAYFATASLGRAREQVEWLLERDPADAYALRLLVRIAERTAERDLAVRLRRRLAALTGDPSDARQHVPGAGRPDEDDEDDLPLG